MCARTCRLQSLKGVAHGLHMGCTWLAHGLHIGGTWVTQSEETADDSGTFTEEAFMVLKVMCSNLMRCT